MNTQFAQAEVTVDVPPPQTSTRRRGKAVAVPPRSSREAEIRKAPRSKSATARRGSQGTFDLAITANLRLSRPRADRPPEAKSSVTSATYLVAVRHAGADALDAIEDVLSEIRKLPGLTEKSRGVFYLRSRAFLHFHEDPTGVYADVRIGQDFSRHRVQCDDERRAFVSLVAYSTSEQQGPSR